MFDKMLLRGRGLMCKNTRVNLMKKGNNKRYRFSGTFEKYGFKYTDRYRTHAAGTVLLIDIKDEDGIVVTDHLWFNLTKGFRSLGILSPGDVISFNGRVKPYQKGYLGHRFGKTQSCTTDYKIDRPTKVTLELTNDKATREKFSTKNWTVCNQIYEMYKEDYQKRGIPKPYV